MVGGASYRAYGYGGSFDATYRAFGNDAAYAISRSSVGTRRPPTQIIVPSPTPLPTLRPVPPSSPGTSSVSVRFQLEYGFSSDNASSSSSIGARRLEDPGDDDDMVGPPTEEEYEGLVVVTQQFFAAILRLTFASVQSIQVAQVGDEFRPDNSLPVLVEFEMILVFVFATGTTMIPTDQEVSNVLQTADYDGASCLLC